MFGLGLGEILLVAVVLLVAVGPERIPSFMREAGKIYGQVKRASDELRRAFVLEADRMDADERYQKLRERQKAAEEARKTAQEATGGAAQAPVLAPPTLKAPGPDAARDATIDADPETPAPPRRPPATSIEAPAEIPDGISADEWSKLPPRVQQMLRNTQAPSPKVVE